jgi:hypothetical protein
MQEMVASVQLIKALGGGWNSATLPSPAELQMKAPAANREIAIPKTPE